MVKFKASALILAEVEIQPIFEISFPVMRATLSWCLCCRVASRTSRASTQSASCPAASTTGPTWDRWPRPLCTRASSGLCWKSQLRCRKNRCVRVRLCYANIFIQCMLHVALRDCWVMAILCVCFNQSVWIRCTSAFCGQNTGKSRDSEQHK